MLSSLGVVIPVRDGEDVIARSLESLVGQRGEVLMHVVIALNGCTDGTRAEVDRYARLLAGAGHRCDVIETAAGRSVAINAAEGLLSDTPRLYLDCDAILSPTAAAAIAATLRDHTGVHFVSPSLRIGGDLGRLPSMYYRTWQRLPYVEHSPATYGAYAVSTCGRRRWREFPALHSDDKFVRLHFTPAERVVLADAWYEILPPRTARELVVARSRYSRGNAELRVKFPELMAGEGRRRAGAVRCLLASPKGWLCAVAFVGLYAAGALWALLQRATARRRDH
jgi:glycosyltransferase involved in cell wall biosynthesis